jgi:hypothetical protein
MSPPQWRCRRRHAGVPLCLPFSAPGGLPVKQCFANAGFDIVFADYSGEAFIFQQASPSRSARAIREQLMLQHKPTVDLPH